MSADSTAPAAARTPPPVSRLALVALGFNIPCFLPPFTLVAALLGAVAWLRIVVGRAPRRGAAIAAAAFVLGAALTVVGTLYWLPGARLMVVGPQDALHAAARGDFDAARACFVGRAATAEDRTLRDFARALDARYGALLRARRDFGEGEASQQGEVWTVPYRLTFERGSVIAEVDITTRDPSTGRPALGLSAIRVKEEGASSPALEFPPSARSSTLAAP